MQRNPTTDPYSDDAYHSHCGCYWCYQTILNAGGDPRAHASETDSMHGFYFAIYHNDVKIVKEKFVSDFKSLTDFYFYGDMTPLKLAIDRGHSEMIELLLAHGANPNFGVDAAAHLRGKKKPVQSEFISSSTLFNHTTASESEEDSSHRELKI